MGIHKPDAYKYENHRHFSVSLQNFSLGLLYFKNPCLTLYSHSEKAKVAQLVERNLAKVEVAGSNPVFRSK